MKYISYDSAVATLRDFFSISPDTDIVSLQQIFVATGRDLSKATLNKQWLSNKLTHLKHYQLVTPVYSQGRRKVLDKIQITQDGKKALGRDIEATDGTVSFGARQITLESIAQDIEVFESLNPSILLDLNVRIKKHNQSYGPSRVSSVYRNPNGEVIRRVS